MDYIENEHIKLRAPEPEDLDFLYETENDTSLWEVSSTLKPYSAYILREYLKNSHKDIFEAKELRLMIDEKSDGSTIGMIDLFDFDPLHRRAGVGIMLSENKRQQGYASEALQLLIDYSFNLLKINQLYCNIIREHQNSIRLFESKGFIKTGVKKAWINGSDGFKDVLFFQLINDK
jgi:diamine N-acetyltransferase